MWSGTAYNICVKLVNSTHSPCPRNSLRYVAGLTDEGLFRRSPSSALLRQVQEAYDRGVWHLSSQGIKLRVFLGHNMSLDTFGDPHLAAVLLKKYLRDLPEPIFTETVYPIILDIGRSRASRSVIWVHQVKCSVYKLVEVDQR